MKLLMLFGTFFKVGLFTFGGGYAMLPLIQEEVLKLGWATYEEILNFIAVSESTPGPFAINMATFVGSRQGGILGAVCATLGVVLPSFIVILIVARIFDKFKNSSIVRGCMSGLKPAVIGLIGSAILSVAMEVFFSNGITFAVFSDTSFYVVLLLFAAMTVCSFKKLHPILIICISAAVGIGAGYALGIPV